MEEPEITNTCLSDWARKAATYVQNSQDYAEGAWWSTIIKQENIEDRGVWANSEDNKRTGRDENSEQGHEPQAIQGMHPELY